MFLSGELMSLGLDVDLHQEEGREKPKRGALVREPDGGSEKKITENIRRRDRQALRLSCRASKLSFLKPAMADRLIDFARFRQEIFNIQRANNEP